MKRRVLSVIAGISVFMVTILLLELLSGKLYPMPEDVNYEDKASVINAIATMPMASFGLLLAGYIIATFAGGAVSTLLSGRNSHIPAVIVGGIATLAGIANLMEIPHPIWFSIINIISYLPAAYLGYVVARKSEPQI